MALKQQIHISRVGVKLKHLSRGAPKGKVCVGHLSSLAHTALRGIYIIISSSECDSHRHCLYSASPSPIPKSKHMLCQKRCRLRLFIYYFYSIMISLGNRGRKQQNGYAEPRWEVSRGRL